MGRKPVPINPECGKRLKWWIGEVGINQTQLAMLIPCAPQFISDIIRGNKNLTPNIAAAVSEKAVKRVNDADGKWIRFERVRPAYLLCDDDIATDVEFSRQFISRQDAINEASATMIQASLQEVCAREGIPVPVLDNIPEILLLQAQLKDFSDALLWNYIKWKDNSHVWTLLNKGERWRRREDDNG